jgi:hypothetical protein
VRWPLQHRDPRLAARLIGTAAEVRDRFGGSGLRPWPWAAQAEQPTIDQAKALLPGGEYTAQLAAGRSQTIDEALAAATPILQDRPPPADLPAHKQDKDCDV